MDGIQPYAGGPKPAPATYSHQAHGFGFGPTNQVHLGGSPHHDAPHKTPGDYLRSLKRRAWLVLTVGVLVAVAGAIVVLRMTPIYRVVAEVTIEPPAYDPFLGKIISKSTDVVHHETGEIEKYVPDKLALLQSRSLISKVLSDPSLNGNQPFNPLDDPVKQVLDNFRTRNRPGTHYWTITLDGADPSKVTRTLTLLLEQFKETSRVESNDVIDNSKRHAQTTISKLTKELSELNIDINKIARNSTAIAPGGTSLHKEQIQQINQALVAERGRYRDLERQLYLESLHPKTQNYDAHDEARDRQLAKYEEEREMMIRRYQRAQRMSRTKDDPFLIKMANEIRDLNTRIARLQEPEPADAQASPTTDHEVILATARQEIHDLEQESSRLMGQMQKSLPEYDDFMNLFNQRENKQRVLSDTIQKLSEFEALSQTQKEPVKIIAQPTEPELPEHPKKGLYIAGITVFGFMIGIALAFLLEHFDHSVKVPEHLTSGLALPLLGVVPRMKRLAKIQRGGHLWTPGIPDSIEADAYRNIRASLLGVAGTHDRIVTLLVTSAKAGEGKSTTALNLAATCARAGERTLLLDVDLRRPSLAEVFPHTDGHLGLVDVLKGDLPWQRVVVPSDLPNLDFIPTGDTRDVPIEILGSRELRQLLLSLSQHHYDRVILDGPAILGLADCRMLGRIVDAAVMVVRSGTMELRPLRRAKSMLEQSQVNIAGLIFNGLNDDLDNWSSYGPTNELVGSTSLNNSPALTASEI
jgi:capsular exopolysaccharide synthesis family protein